MTDRELMQPEPTVWMYEDELPEGYPYDAMFGLSRIIEGVRMFPANLTPAQRKPLTNEQIWREYQSLWPFHPAEEPRLAADLVTFARAIEVAHGIYGVINSR